MSSRTATTVLVVALLVTTALTAWLTDFEAEGAAAKFMGIVGSNASILGILYSLYQLSHLRAETALIKQASEETKSKILTLQHYGEISAGISLIPEIQNYLRSRKFELAIVKIQELKRILTEAIGNASDTTAAGTLKEEIQSLNLLISSFEKEIEEKRKSIQICQVNSDLERIRDLLLDLSAALKINL